MYKNSTISVVFPAYNEEKGVKAAIEDFFSTGIVDEIVVVDNNSKDRTAEIVRKTKARLVVEKKQGYGFALRRGLMDAKGDLIFMAEPDGTFQGSDLFKFLPYVDECDVIFGTRTSKTLIWDKAKMSSFLRFGNVFIAKALEYLHNGPCLTDVGCTLKVIHRRALKKIENKFTVGRSEFSPEFMVLCIKSKMRVLEIPVNYKPRVGISKITNNSWNSFKLGLKMIWLIVAYKFK